MSKMALTKNEVLNALRNIAGLPDWTKKQKYVGRSIYETGDSRGRGTGEFQIDFASFPGGTSEYVPRPVIDELERDGLIVRAFADNPKINAWKLKELVR